MVLLYNVSIQAQTKTCHIKEKYDVFVPVTLAHIGGEPKKFIVAKTDGNNQLKYGLIDAEGEVLVPLEYDEIDTHSFTSVRFMAKKNSKWGVINDKNEIKVPLIYDEILKGGNPGYIVAQNGKYGLIDWDGKEIIPYEYDRMDYDGSGVYSVEKDGEKYFINKNNKQILMEYTYVVKETIHMYRKGGRYKVIAMGVINNYGKLRVGALYNRLRVTDGINSVYGFSVEVSGNEKEISAYFTVDAFTNFSADATIEILYGWEVVASIKNVNIHDITPLPAYLESAPYELLDNVWLLESGLARDR